MNLGLELSRRCDMTCSHCLRGDAQGQDMSEHTLRTVLQVFGAEISHMFIGGGEPTLKPELLTRLRHNMLWAEVRVDSMFIVTNGKRLVKELDRADYDDYDEYGDVLDGPAMDAIRKLSWSMQVDLTVSTDRWHGPLAHSRYVQLESAFEHVQAVSVNTQGPAGVDNLVGIGRARGYKALKIHLGEECNDIRGYSLTYVTIKGDVYVSCDMSYAMMDSLQESKVCIGNVHKNSFDDISANFRALSTVDSVELWEGMSVEDVDSQFVIP